MFEALLDVIRTLLTRINDTDWDMTFEAVKRFGDRPLHKGTIGFIAKS